MCVGHTPTREGLGYAVIHLCVWSHTPTREVLGNAMIHLCVWSHTPTREGLHLRVCAATLPLGKAQGMV